MTTSIQPVILAGGSGTRLWPASRQAHPKQLLALTGDHSFLQQTALRLRALGGAGPAAPEAASTPGAEPPEAGDGRTAAALTAAAPAASDPSVADPVVVTNEDCRYLVADQLREVGVGAPRIVLEPVGRNTAPALTVAALLLGDGGYDPVMLVLPSDHLIRDVPAFVAAVTEGAAQAEAGMLVTFGIVPDRPETGYGYIRVGAPAAGARSARHLAGFTEKPDTATAREYIDAGDHLWNSGIFMARRSVWLAALETYRPDILAACQAAAEGHSIDGLFVRLAVPAFAACPADSIDYAVMEKLDPGRAVVVPLDAGWSDAGGWDALWTVLDRDAAGNVSRGDVILEDTRNSLVYADSRLVTVLGADDLVVVETADAVLVAPRAKTGDLKRLVARIQQDHADLTVRHRRTHGLANPGTEPLEMLEE